MKVIGFGDNIVDRFLDRKMIYPGGNCVNFAVLARRLGLDAGYVGVFGNDVLGDFVRSALVQEGVDISRCVTREGPNGVTEIEVVDGDRVFLGWNNGGVTIGQPFELEPEHLAYLATADLVHSSVYSASESQLPLVRDTGALVSFDYSSEPDRRTDEYFNRTAPYIDLALLSLGGHTRQSAEHELRRVVEAGAALAVGTRGADGAVLFDGDAFLMQDAVPIDPGRFADTMGCGDAFLTGMVVSLLTTGWTKRSRPSARSLAEALGVAARAAAEQCSVEGAFGYGRPAATPTRI